MASALWTEFAASAWLDHRFGLSEERWQLLRGKAVWVTGAGTGYGRAIACNLAAAGCRVFLTGRRRAKLEETVEEARVLFISSEAGWADSAGFGMHNVSEEADGAQLSVPLPIPKKEGSAVL